MVALGAGLHSITIQTVWSPFFGGAAYFASTLLLESVYPHFDECGECVSWLAGVIRVMLPIDMTNSKPEYCPVCPAAERSRTHTGGQGNRMACFLGGDIPETRRRRAIVNAGLLLTRYHRRFSV